MMKSFTVVIISSVDLEVRMRMLTSSFSSGFGIFFTFDFVRKTRSEMSAAYCTTTLYSKFANLIGMPSGLKKI